MAAWGEGYLAYNSWKVIITSTLFTQLLLEPYLHTQHTQLNASHFCSCYARNSSPHSLEMRFFTLYHGTSAVSRAKMETTNQRLQIWDSGKPTECWEPTLPSMGVAGFLATHHQTCCDSSSHSECLHGRPLTSLGVYYKSGAWASRKEPLPAPASILWNV